MPEQGNNSDKRSETASLFNFHAEHLNIRESQFADVITQEQQVKNSGVRVERDIRNVSTLISTLREISKSFPEEHKKEVLLDLDSIDDSLDKDEVKEPIHIRNHLKRLMAVGATVFALSGGAATVSGNLNEISGDAVKMTENATLFTEKVKQLAGELGFDIGQYASTP